MGDVVRRVKIAPLTQAAKPGTAVPARGYLDTGASKSVMSTRLAAKLGGRFMALKVNIKGYVVPTKLVALSLDAKGCPLLPIIAAVSDELVAVVKIPGVDMIIGHDYLQGGRTLIAMREDGNEGVRCTPPKASPPRRRATV